MNSEQLFEKAKEYTPGGVHSPVRSFKGLHTTPRFMKKANGAFITDEEDKEYIDFCMSFGPLILGHKNQAVLEKAKEAMENGWSFGAAEKYSLELAQYIVDRIDHIEKVRFMNSGTEAVMTAIRLARGATGKNKILKFNGCYHGHMDQMLIKAGSGLAGEAEASSKGVTPSTAEDTLVCELGDLEEVKNIFKNHSDIAAIFIEPLPANNGLLPQSLEYLKGLRQICDEHNALLVFDEVISGFRTSFGGMAQDTGITPDIVTYGKVIGGGFPVGAVAGKKEVMDLLAPVGGVYQAGTLSANPVAMVAGLATLKQLDDNFYANLKKNTDSIVGIFNEWFAQSEFSDYKIVQQASLFWMVPGGAPSNASQIPANLLERFNRLFEVLLNKGIYLSPNGYEIGFVSAAHNESVQEELKQRLWS
ncbi:MAG: aspartate aminotransferase family protein [Halobacteriovoraceae bacterium]|nr:aspartate aminotransferase family protein [Halobacteriovoraceae bacterium]|tara:strand:+ start:122629 stop:123882 length:1254 start_codon:yes stop_codon:yes gene_type:complete